MRSYIRAGLESVVEIIMGYSRDLPVCARCLSQCYPELEEVAWKSVELAVEPSARVAEMWEVVAKLTPFLLERRLALGLTAATDNRVLKRKGR